MGGGGIVQICYLPVQDNSSFSSFCIKLLNCPPHPHNAQSIYVLFFLKGVTQLVKNKTFRQHYCNRLERNPQCVYMPKHVTQCLTGNTVIVTVDCSYLPPGGPRRRERGELSLLSETLHGSLVERSQVHSNHCRHEKVSVTLSLHIKWNWNFTDKLRNCGILGQDKTAFNKTRSGPQRCTSCRINNNVSITPFPSNKANKATLVETDANVKNIKTLNKLTLPYPCALLNEFDTVLKNH